MTASEGRNRARIASAAAVLIAALAALALAGALGAASASAIVLHLPGRTVGYQPLPGHGAPLLADGRRPAGRKAGKGKPITDHGGPVMTSNTNHVIYWDPPGAPAYPAEYVSGINRWFEDLAHDSGGIENSDSVLDQYGTPYNSHFAGGLADTDPYPASGCPASPPKATCLTEAQIRAEIASFVAGSGLPTGLGHEYFLVTPEGVESCFEEAGKQCSAGTNHPKYCAYHGFIEGSEIVFANIPFTVGLGCAPGEDFPNGPSDAAIAGGIAHEHSESVTDPQGTAWYDSKLNEVADKCRSALTEVEFGEPLGKAPDGSPYNEVIAGDLYWYQQFWSNETGACAQRLAARPTVTKLAPKKGSAEGGTKVTVTGSGFFGAVSVGFGGIAASEVEVKNTTTLVAVSPPHAKGAAEVVVTNEAGSSPPNKKAVFKYSAH